MVRFIFHMLRALVDLIKIMDLSVPGTERGAHGHKELRILRHNDMLRSQMQRLNKTMAQLRQKVQRTSQKSNVTANGLAAGQSSDGLVDYGLKNGCRDIFAVGALV